MIRRPLEEIAHEAAEAAIKNALAAGARFVESEHPRGHGGKFTTSWHITDNPKFAFDPTRVGVVNSTIGGDMKEPGLFVTKNPEFWVNGHDYVRPFIAEIEHPEEGVGTGYYENRDSYLPASLYPQSKVERLIPLDEWVRENYHNYGWIERHHGTDIHGNPLPEESMFGPTRDLPEDYRYAGPDVRDMPTAEVKKHMDRAAQYIEQGERKYSMLRAYDDNGEYAVGPNGEQVFEKMRWNYTPSGKLRASGS